MISIHQENYFISVNPWKQIKGEKKRGKVYKISLQRKIMKPKHVFVALLVLLNFAFYSYEGYLFEASLLFNVFYFATLLGSAFVLSNLEGKPLVVFSLLTVIFGFGAEYVNTKALNWWYFNNAQPPIFVPIGWVSLFALIFYGSRFLAKSIDWKINSVIPSLLCFGLFFVLSYTEGNITSVTLGLYLFMAVFGIYAAYSGEFGWSAAIFIVGVVVGSISEALGASCGLWTFRSGQLLPLPMVVTWSARAFCISGLLKLFRLSSKNVFRTYLEAKRAEAEEKEEG